MCWPARLLAVDLASHALTRLPAPRLSLIAGGCDARRASWLPPLPLLGAKLLELRKRTVLVAVTVAFMIALPILFYAIRLVEHASDRAHYAAAGAPDGIATAGALMAEFGFIAAVALGATAATGDVDDGMFRHLVITGRSRIALYLARVPAGLAILLALAGIGYALSALATAYLGNPNAATPSAGALAGAGAWLELYLTVGLGLAALMGQRTVPIVLLVVLEIIITPVLAAHELPHLIDAQRLVVGIPLDQLQPSLLAGGHMIGPAHGSLQLPPMPTWEMVAVIVGWIVGWLAIGAWKTATREA